jgi:hypothetical protein|tara:strand:- start:446 stop:919 length:474 start_codon:yes stop_codon:yes gene_type:complete
MVNIIMDFAQKHAFKQADPKYQAFTKKIQEKWQEKRKINSKQCKVMREICQLNHAMDLVRCKSFNFEETSNETDTLLDDSTGMDGEGWFWTYHNGAEEIEKIMIQKCIKVANLAVQWDVLTKTIAVLNNNQDEYGDKLVKKAEAKETKKSDKEVMKG